ncbi:uncharacterized protein PHACADRAFT_262095 [Phanerochaete carnosa HHB-10118-sp]|uniref:Uncharacterized protein n=1 Tax=Phanerochaete carnosa (strain HHB-10118-sp) TaxID=650164 RepID=K5VYS9_PHACS|nr:uncharacterized protein PHACADRAFT_262095 [Phanerochaete carnosa HHB-10118-sp]EKM51764.1 hypothetical protein PHACADRAFT_262095 [Phanerochaete carnosa HHB-10118-sp]
MKSRTPTRLGVEFRASRWEGSAPRDVWQSVRALREESRDEPDCRDKLLNRATCMGD